jgi:hypothetical protein
MASGSYRRQQGQSTLLSLEANVMECSFDDWLAAPAVGGRQTSCLIVMRPPEIPTRPYLRRILAAAISKSGLRRSR